MPVPLRPPSVTARGRSAALRAATAIAGLAMLSACSASPSGSSPGAGAATSAGSSPAAPPGSAPGASTIPGTTAPGTTTPDPARPVAATAPACSASGSYLTAVRAGRQPASDRVVFEFTGTMPASYAVTRVSQVVADGSGKPVAIAGRSFLRVTFRGATAVCPATGHPAYRGPAALTPRLPQVQGLAAAGDFEGYLSWGIGLATKASYHVFTLTAPNRVVIDVSR